MLRNTDGSQGFIYGKEPCNWIMGEYDALPTDQNNHGSGKSPVEDEAFGHGCKYITFMAVSMAEKYRGSKKEMEKQGIGEPWYLWLPRPQRRC